MKNGVVMKKFLLSIFTVVLLVTVAVTVVFAESNPKIKFMGDNYSLKWSNEVENLGYINEYLTNGENFDNYHTMITIHQITTSNNKDSVTQALYNTFKQKGLAKTSKISDDANYIKFCAVAQVPVKHVECSYYNIQNGVGDVMLFQFTKRYYPSEIENANVMGKMMVDDENVFKPHIEKIVMPKIVKKIISAPSSYIYFSTGSKK